MPARQSKAISWKRPTPKQRITWQYEGDTSKRCLQAPQPGAPPGMKCTDFIELNQWWSGTGELTSNAPTYSAYWGFSNPSMFSLTGGSCSNEAARFLPVFEDVKEYCGMPTSSHPHQCPSWETVDGIEQTLTCSTECDILDECGGEFGLCYFTNPDAWQCGPKPTDTTSGLYKNWYLCRYWYLRSFAGPTGLSHTFSDGSFVNYWCGSNSCNNRDVMAPGVTVGGSCTQGGVADLTITTCPEF